MTALTGPRSTLSRGSPTGSYGEPMAASVIAYRGALAVRDMTGHVRPGRTALADDAMGMFTQYVDNSSGSAGDKHAEIEAGTFLFGNSTSSDQITAADSDSVCYIVDDQTVAKTDGSSTRSVAGIVDGVENGSVWVRIGPRS